MKATTIRVALAGTLALLGNRGYSTEGFILKTGEGERLQNGIVVKASPKTGTKGSILVEQTLQREGTTPLHIHEQSDELF